VWEFSTNADVGTAPASCPAGFFFDSPRTYVENLNLAQTVNSKSSGCWLNANATVAVPKYIDMDSNNNNNNASTATQNTYPPYTPLNTGLSHFCDFNQTFNGNKSSGGSSDEGGKVDPNNVFGCNLKAYGDDIVQRSIGFIVFCVILVLLAIGACIGICVFSCKSLCNKEHEPEGKGVCEHMLYLLPVGDCLDGLFLIIVGSNNVTLAFNNTEFSIRGLISKISDTRDRFEAAMPRIGKYFNRTSVNRELSSIKTTIEDVNKGVDSIMGVKNDVDRYRSVATVVFACVPIVLLLLGFLFHKCKSNCLLGTTLILANV